MLRVGVVVAIALAASGMAERIAEERSIVNARDGRTYVWIPGGAFKMGCPPSDLGCYAWEESAHEVRVERGFWIGKTEVTQKAFGKVMGKNPSRYQHEGDDRPVEQVSWNDAKAYCATIGMRLPTEIEWEYAARGGVEAPYYGKLDEIAWYEVNTRDETKVVARLKANAFGLYDMLGNVWEWVEDSYGEEGMRVLRGGSFISGERDIRVSNRSWAAPDAAYRYMGFRCVSDDTEPL